MSDMRSIRTKGSELGCLFTPYFATTKYGLNSITRKCIDSWNMFSKTFNIDLLTFSRPSLKEKIKEHFIANY